MIYWHQMRKAAWILATLFGLVFIGATILNAELVAKSRSALTAAGLAGSLPSPEARFHLLVILPDSDDAFFAKLLEGILSGAQDAGVAMQVERYPAADTEEAERWFDIGLRSRVDGLIMYAARGDDVAQRASLAKAAGVVFVAVGKDAPAGPLPCFIGSGSLLQGYQGGGIIAGSLKGAARIGLILPSGRIDGSDENYLYKGVEASISMFRGARIVATAWSEPGLLSGEGAAAALIRSHPDINAIFCANSRDSLGAAQVLVDQNLVGRILLVGADETPELLRYLDKGVIAASVVRNSRRIGEEALGSFSRMKAGGPDPGIIEVDSVARLGGAKK